MLPVAAAGGVAGGLLLLHSGEAAFKAIVPYLILVAAAALVAQGRLREWLVARSGGEHSEGWRSRWWRWRRCTAASSVRRWG
jgi:uncharacterized membrane protein YfcA